NPQPCLCRHQTQPLFPYTTLFRSELEAAGTHVLGIKDMAGLARPRAAYTLVKALKEEIGLPVHFHTHDTSGIAAASVLAAIDAGDRKSTRLNSSHVAISYAVFCLK